MLSVLLTALMVFTVMPLSVSAEEDIVDQFMDLQDKVTAVLEVDGDQYVYSEDEVISVIKNENFDFEALNEVLGTNYTEDSFIEIALYNIENTELGIRYYEGSCPVQTRGTYCGRNADESGWNYDRYFRDKEQTQDWIDDSRDLANQWDGINIPASVILDILPGKFGNF